MKTDTIFKNLMSKIKPQWKVTFVGTFIFGLCAHMFAMTHNFLTFDSMWNIYSNQDMITSGRQFLTFACLLSSYYALPWVTGLLAIIYLSVAAVLLCESFSLKGNVLCVLVGGLLVTFPSVASTFAYSYTIDGYMLAVLLAVIAFLVTDRQKFGFIAGIVCMGLSLGIYQAYFSFTILMCMFAILLMILRNTEFKIVAQKAIRYLLMGVGGYAFYIVTLKIMLAVKNTAISGYQGTDKLMSFRLSSLPEGLKAAWDNFYYFFRYGGVFSSAPGMKLFYILFMGLGIVLFISLFVQRKCYKTLWTIPVTLLIVIVLPFASCLISVLSSSTYFHLLMRLPWVVMMAFVIALIEEAESEEWKFAKGCMKYLPIGCAIFGYLLAVTFSVSSNIVYFNLNERYEKTYALCVRMVDRIEKTKEYEPGMPVSILGGFPNPEYYPSTDITSEDLAGYFGVDGDLVVNSSTSYQSFCSHYLGFTFETLDQAGDEKIAATKEFSEMETFPYEGSVKVIDDVLVIKLNG